MRLFSAKDPKQAVRVGERKSLTAMQQQPTQENTNPPKKNNSDGRRGEVMRSDDSLESKLGWHWCGSMELS